jgi:hypothetical protein
MKDQQQSKCGHSVHRRTVHPRNLQDAASSDLPECGRWSNARHIPSVQFTCKCRLDSYVREHGPLLSTPCWNSACIRDCERGVQPTGTLHSRNWTRFCSLRPLRSWVGSWRHGSRVVLAYGAVSADRSSEIAISADCSKQLAHACIDSGSIRVQEGQIEIVVKADKRHHTSVRKPRTHASRRISEAPVPARAVAVIRPVPIIIAFYLVPLHPVWQTPVACFLVFIPLFQPHLATKHAIHKNEVAESEAHPQRPPNKPHS